MSVSVEVLYTAENPIANPQALAEMVKRNIEAHVNSIDDQPIRNCNLRIEIVGFEITGKVKMLLTGVIDDKAVDVTTLHLNKRPQLSTRRSRSRNSGVETAADLKRKNSNGPVVLCC